MYFNDMLHRRLASLLRPWLREEPELETKLGFLRSHAIAKNLRFDASVLNQSIDDPSRLCIKELNVECISIHISYWSVPAVRIEVRGVNLILSVGEQKGECSRNQKSTDTSSEDLKKALSAIDPEGSALHDVLERILFATSRNQFSTSVLDLFLRHCQLQMRGIQLQVQFPFSDDYFMCLAEASELDAGSQNLKHGCFLRGLVSAACLPSKESCFILNFGGFKIGLKRKDHVNYVVSATDMSACFKLKDLQLVHCNLCVPESSFSFSPIDIALLLAVNKFLPKKSKRARNGRQLWKLTRSRIGYLSLTPKLSWHKLVDAVTLWLCYVNTYEHLLLLVRFSSDSLLRSAVKMSRDTKFSSSIKQDWKLITEIENELPAEAIARARRIGRYRAALNDQFAEDSCTNSLGNSHLIYFRKILQLLAFIWKVICIPIHALARFLFVMEHSARYSTITSEEPCPRYYLGLELGKISITVFPMSAAQPPVSKKLKSHIGISHLDLVSFCLSINALFLRYTEDICEQSFSVSFGHLKVMSSSVMIAPFKESRLKRGKGKVNDSQTILWSEPVQTFLVSDISGTDKHAEGAGASFLECFLRDTWLRWKRSFMAIEGSEIQDLESPCLLFEIMDSITDSGLKNLDSGSWKSGLLVGKLNFALGYSSILSFALFLSQVQRALCWTEGNGSARVHADSPINKDPPDNNWNNSYSKFSGRMMSMLRVLPEKRIQLGVLIAGPHLQISLRKEDFYGGNEDVNNIISQDYIHLAFNVHNIEAAVWPSSESDLVSTTGHPVDNVKTECHRLKETQKIEIPRSENEDYVSQGQISLASYLTVNGINAYLEDSAEKQQCQLFESKSVTFHFTNFRDHLLSFSSDVVACSAEFCGIATGFTTLLYMDELSFFIQAVSGLHSALSYACTKSDSLGLVQCQELMSQDMTFTEPENQTTALVSPLACTLFIINGTLDLKSVDIILHNSRKSTDVEVSMKSAKRLAEFDLPDCGILISVQQISIEISCEEEKAEVLNDLSGIQAAIFRYQRQIGKSNIMSENRNPLLQSLNCLYEMSISNCTLALWMGSLQSASSSGSVVNELNGHTSGCKSSCTEENSSSTVVIERSSSQPFKFSQKLGFTSSILAPVTSHWLLVNFTLSEIFITSCSLKSILIGAHQSRKLLSSLSVGGEFQRISFGIQGVFIFLETTALAMLLRSSASYFLCVTTLLSLVPSFEKRREKVEPDFNTTRLNDNSIEEYAPGILDTFQPAKFDLLEALTMDLSQFSLVLVIEDKSDGFREFVLEADAHLNLEVANMKRTFLFNLSRFSILSQVLHKGVEIEVQNPQFSSVMSNDISSNFVSGDSTIAVRHRDGISPATDGTSCSSSHISQKESSGLSYQSYILKHLGAIISVEKPVLGVDNSSLHINQIWVGSGSVSGFDMTISLYEIQMMLSMEASFSGISSVGTTSNMKQRHGYKYQESDNNLGGAIPDGSIVAIQDVHQHMYFSVENVENRYGLAGAIHYSLVGERALFRVKYQKQRKWKLPASWFSLISLYAKSESGEPLRLNYLAGSGFVDVSSTNDNGGSLWTTLSYKPETFEGDLEWEPCKQLAKNNFYLVNKKNDCAVAFVDGVPEFVRKPGNLFKFKVFDVGKLGSYSVEASESNLQHKPQASKERILQTGVLPSIDVRIEKVTLTIVHELPDTKDKFPLLQGCIDNIQLIVQVLSSKARVVSTFMVAFSYFDAQRNLWREFIPPAEFYIFYRTIFQIQAPEYVLHGVPVHFYFRLEKLDISLTELSLDILLFMIGELNLAGPYSVKSSTILANCCKVENQSGLNLLCHFSDDQDVTIARNQSASILLRRLALADPPSGNAPVVSIQLARPGAFSTSPIHISFLKARALAWRTRIVSLQDSSSYPGPFVVLDISRKTEDGLTIAVSPLIKIHNETEFPMELRFQRPQQKETESASVLLKSGDTIDDSVAVFDALNSSGELKKTLRSLSVGNFLFSFRPKKMDGSKNVEKSVLVEWSDELKGGKAVRLAGLFDKLNYRVRKAFSVQSAKCSFSTARCSIKSENALDSDMHFLIQSIGRDVPVVKPDMSGDALDNRTPVALQEQKEIFLLPTVRVSNLLQSEIHVLLTETDLCATSSRDNIGNQATIPCGSTINLYANPAIIYFIVTLTALKTSCKPVNSNDWLKRLSKQKTDVHCLDIDLEFCGGKYHASLRLFRGLRGILEAVIYTSYTLKNDTDFPFFFYPPYQKPLSRDEIEKFGSSIPPEFGLVLPPKSTGSWFLKSNKVHLKFLEAKASEELLQLDALSGLTEISLEREDASGFKYVTKLGLSLGPSLSKVVVPSQTVTMVPRYVVVNESKEAIIFRQCYLEDDVEGTIISSGQKTTLQLRNGIDKRRQISLFDNFIKKHRSVDESLIYIQFRLNVSKLGWSGPVCIASLGRFFLKFRKSLDSLATQPSEVVGQDEDLREFAAVHVVQEGSTHVLHFKKPPDINLPYRIENSLREASLTYYQKDSSLPETLGSESNVDYVWDDTTLPHKLVVHISDMHLLREINLDKVRPWKPFFNIRQRRGLDFPLPLDKNSKDKKRNYARNIEMVKVGYEIYADGPTRVLRICEFSGSRKGDTVLQSSSKIRLRISNFAIHFLEQGKQDLDANELSLYTPIIVARLGNISLDSLFTDQQKYNQIRIQSLNVDQKWVGAPFAAMLRGHLSNFSDTSDIMLHVVFVLLSSSSNVKQVKYSSIVLRPVDLNLDEETLMRLVPFWRTSLSNSTTPSQQYYFDHFEIHPIKIIASFLPGDSYSSYSTSQETLRSLLHSVIKIPAMKNMVVELNGVLVTHALITMRELFIKCAQHYSWYAMRAIYMAKGSSLLPPAFASMFDDMASSSLDVFFDPSRGLPSLPGLTLGTFKLISKCIDAKGFSGTKRYFGDLGKTLRTAGSNVLFAAITEISDSVLKGAEASGVNGMVTGFHQGILKLAMEPSLLGTMFMEGGPDRKIKLDRSPGVDELYIEGYLQAMLETIYKQEYLRVRVVDDQVFLKNLPPNSTLIDEIMDRVKGFLISKALLKGDSSTSRPLRHLRGEIEWKIGPAVLTLCEHLFVSFAIRMLRRQTGKLMTMTTTKWKEKSEPEDHTAIVPATPPKEEGQNGKFIWKWGIGKFVLSAMVAYVDGRLCRCIPNPIARRIVSGFLLSFLDNNGKQ